MRNPSGLSTVAFAVPSRQGWTRSLAIGVAILTLLAVPVAFAGWSAIEGESVESRSSESSEETEGGQSEVSCLRQRCQRLTRTTARVVGRDPRPLAALIAKGVHPAPEPTVRGTLPAGRLSPLRL